LEFTLCEQETGGVFLNALALFRVLWMEELLGVKEKERTAVNTPNTGNEDTQNK